MGASQNQKAENHDRIVEVAARQIREGGTERPSVAEIMAAAGLTHGGFYKHFDSREDLVAEAADRALGSGEEAAAAVIDGAADPLAAFVDWYVSAAHRDDPGGGCAVVALGADAPRADGRVRAAYRAQVERYLAHLEAMLGGEDADVRRRAVVALSTMVGAVLVARAVDDEALSDEILRDVREAVAAGSPA
jgi:TetR/AcrR family transcriptional repressor of nem operon